MAGRRGGDAQTLRDYWSGHGHPGPSHGAERDAIRWGEPGDFDRCVAQVSDHMSVEQAKGYCNLRHHDALGYYPATHAEMEGKALDAEIAGLVADLNKGYNPSQQRVASGNVQGGQFGSQGTPSQRQAAVVAVANAAHRRHVAHQRHQAETAQDTRERAAIRAQIAGLQRQLSQLSKLKASLSRRAVSGKPSARTGTATRPVAGTVAAAKPSKPAAGAAKPGTTKPGKQSLAQINADIARVRAQIAQLQQQLAGIKSVGGGMPAILKVGPHGYVHGWIRVGPGTPEHDRQLNELAGLVADHSNEAAGAIDRARMASQEGRYRDAKDHLDNAAFLLHAAGHHGLAAAAEEARDELTGYKPDARVAAGQPVQRVRARPVPPSGAREFEAVMSMPGGIPVGTPGYGEMVTAPVRESPRPSYVSPPGTDWSQGWPGEPHQRGRKKALGSRNPRDRGSGRFRTFEGELREAKQALAEGRMSDVVELLGSARALATTPQQRLVLGELQEGMARTQHVVPQVTKGR